MSDTSNKKSREEVGFILQNWIETQSLAEFEVKYQEFMELPWNH